jgi:hypothetical protein
MLAIAVLAACSTDQPSQQPLLPTTPSFAASQQCKNSLANNIGNQIDQLYNGTQQTTLENQFAAIQSTCPNVSTATLLGFLQLVLDNSTLPTTNGSYAQGIVNLWSSVVLFVTNTTQTWSPAVVTGDGAVGGVPDGGAKVLNPGDNMTTFDGQAGLSIPSSVSPSGPHLFTFEQVAGSLCDAGTSLRLNGRCYEINDYPDGGTYSPPATLTLCLHALSGPVGIGHAKSGFGTEVLPEVTTTFSCAHDSETALNSWLGRVGPLGRALASAVDYLRPKSLFADDAGESGSIGSFSLAGGVYNDIFQDNFDDPTDFNDGTDVPDIGDTWTINASSPGYIQQQPSAGDLSGGVVVLSQGQGACNNCPVFRLLGTRVNSSQDESIGSYDITWTSVQTKPSVKEGPFVVLNKNTSNNEIARLSYVTKSSQNKLMFSVNGGTPIEVGTWVQNVHQDFKITVNLDVLNNSLDNKVWLSINGTTVAGPITASRATSLKQIGYVLTGIDAGIIGSDNWTVTRLPDIPPP